MHKGDSMTEHQHTTKEVLDQVLDSLLNCPQCQEILADWVAKNIREIFYFPGDEPGM